MNREEGVDLARAVLTMEADPGVRLGDDGVAAEANALAFATGIEITTNDEKWTPSPQHLHPGTANFRLAAEALETGDLKFIATDLSELTEKAATDKAAHDACRLIFKTKAEQGESIPPELGQWVINGTRPRKGAHKNKPRDRAICLAVHWLEQQGICATRSDASSHRGSACDYVSEAMGFRCGYDAVKAVWEKYKHELFTRSTS